MEFETSNDYDLYAFGMLDFICLDCKEGIEPPDWYQDCDEEFCYYIARRAESAGWYICFDKHMTCYCPICRKRKGI